MTDLLQMLKITGGIWGVIITIFYVVNLRFGRQFEVKRTDALSELLILNALGLVGYTLFAIYQGESGEFAFWAVRITVAIEFTLVPVTLMVLRNYIIIMLSESETRLSRFWNLLRTLAALTNIFIILASQYHGLVYSITEDNMLALGPYFWLNSALRLYLLASLAMLVIYHSRAFVRSEYNSLLLYITSSFVVTLFQPVINTINLDAIVSTLTLMLVYNIYLNEKNERYLFQSRLLIEHELTLAEQKAQLAQKDAAIKDKRNQIAVSQIRPHFIFNALGSIEQLCRTNPEKAAEATHYFAQYLRTNLNAMNGSQPIAFSDELRHIRTYVWLEQMRFGDDFRLVENIETENFYLPMLSVQPLVENAIKHGMRDDGSQLTITLTAREDGNDFVVSVSDDGVGFNPSAAPRDGRQHYGLSNVRERVADLAGGSFQLKSEPGKGTTVTLRIPKKIEEELLIPED